MNNIKSFEGLLRAAPTKVNFLRTCHSLKTPDVIIDDDALGSYATSLSVPEFINGWPEYLTPGSDLVTDFVELAVSTVQEGGYLYADKGDGHTRKWQVDGSGSKALHVKMDKVRAAGILPAIHIDNLRDAQKSLSGIFNDAPYPPQRTAIWRELATRGKADQLKAILSDAKLVGGGYRFDFSTLKALAKTLPQGLGEDPFLKKASLLTIIFAGVAHHKLAPDSVSLDVIVPADCRIPQTLHNIGILRLSDDMVRAIESGALLQENDPLVTQLRVQTILAVEEILQCRPDMQMHHIDGELWQAGRLFDAIPGSLNAQKSEMRKALESHGYSSNFRSKDFRRKTGQAINVATLRF